MWTEALVVPIEWEMTNCTLFHAKQKLPYLLKKNLNDNCVGQIGNFAELG